MLVPFSFGDIEMNDLPEASNAMNERAEERRNRNVPTRFPITIIVAAVLLFLAVAVGLILA
jgi:hypothetical protein